MTYEESMQNVVEWAQRTVTKKDFWVDVGANRGYITKKVLEIVKPREILMVEPFPRIGELDYGGPRTLYRGVVLDEEKECEINLDWEFPERSTIINRGVGDYKIKLMATTLDKLLHGTKGPYIIKIDTEFTEPLVWKGMQKILHQTREMCIEFFPEILTKDAGLNAEEFLEMIDRDGFKVRRLGHDIFLTRK